jgi:hypothetical protein
LLVLSLKVNIFSFAYIIKLLLEPTNIYIHRYSGRHILYVWRGRYALARLLSTIFVLFSLKYHFGFTRLFISHWLPSCDVISGLTKTSTVLSFPRAKVYLISGMKINTQCSCAQSYNKTLECCVIISILVTIHRNLTVKYRCNLSFTTKTKTHHCWKVHVNIHKTGHKHISEQSFFVNKSIL